jgi:hypothetical protein
MGSAATPKTETAATRGAPRQRASVGRIVLGVLVGMLLGFVEPFVLSFLDIALSGQGVGLLLVTVPGTALVGGLRAAHRKPRQ